MSINNYISDITEFEDNVDDYVIHHDTILLVLKSGEKIVINAYFNEMIEYAIRMHLVKSYSGNEKQDIHIICSYIMANPSLVK